MEHSQLLDTLIPAQLLINSIWGYIFLSLDNNLNCKMKFILRALRTS